MSAQPPAKRVCLEAPSYEAFERPSTPVDDMDDDFYDATPVKPLSPRMKLGEPSLRSPSLSEPAVAVQLPGLRLLEDKEGKDAFPASKLATQPKNDSNVQTQKEQINTVTKLESVAGSGSLHGDRDAAEGATNDHFVVHSNENILGIHEHGASKGTIVSHDQLEAAKAVQKEMTSAVPGEEEDAKADFLTAAEANRGNENAEWQLDSSDSDSDSDSSDSSSDDSSDESSDEDGGVLLDPEEQARILMQADVDEDPGIGEGTTLRTKNESDEKYEKPNITITEDMKVTELGNIESVVENMVLVKANVSGEYQVLESGSVLCKRDRTVIGTVSETLGRVHEPRYLVGFSNAADIVEAGLEKDTTIFYVDEHSTFVFTQPLKGMKYTDASNVHDEEAGANEIEFSDDEAEAIYKRNLKQAKKARADARRDHHQADDHPSAWDAPPSMQGGQYQSGGLQYSDDEDMGMYKPLARPDNFEAVVGAGAPIEDRSHVKKGNSRSGRGGWVDRGRGGRGRGGAGGGRGDRGNRSGRQSERHGRHQDNHRHDHRRPDNRARPSRSPTQHRRSPALNRQQVAPPPLPASMPSYTASPAVNSQAHAYNGWPATGVPSATFPSQSPQGGFNAGIPAGAFVNPAFFQSQTNPTLPQGAPPAFQGQWQTATQQPNWAALAQFFQSASQNQPQTSAAGTAQPQDSQAAYMAVQQQIDLLRSLSRGSGSPQ